MSKHLAHVSKVDGTRRWYTLTPVPTGVNPETGKETWMLVANCGILDYQDDRIYFIRDMPMVSGVTFEEMSEVKVAKEKELQTVAGYKWQEDKEEETSLVMNP